MAISETPATIKVVSTAMDGLIIIDDRGIARLADSRIRVVGIVMEQMKGYTPQQIQEAYPHISMAKIHAALAYYYEHQAELDAKIEREARVAEELRKAAGGVARREAIAGGRQAPLSVALYMDEQVEGAITRGLQARGVDVLTAQEDGMDDTPDPALLDRAGELGRLMLTRDVDFLIEAARRQRSGETFVGVVYAHLLKG